MHSVEPEGLDLGGGEAKGEPEAEAGNKEHREEPDIPGSRFSPIQEPWGNEDYNDYYADDYGPWGWMGGHYILSKMEDDREEGFTTVKSKKTKREERKEILQITGNNEWVQIDAVVDSGAIDTICPRGMIGGNELRETEISKRGGKYAAADGGAIRNLGESKIQGESITDGTPIEFTTQVGDRITKMLLAVRRMTESGNMVIFGANLKSIRKLAALDKLEPNLIVGKN